MSLDSSPEEPGSDVPLPTDPNKRRSVLMAAAEMKLVFMEDKQRRFLFDSLIGAGENGLACKITQLSQGNKPERQFVVKQAIGRERDASMDHEIAILKRLRGMRHIVQINDIMNMPLLLYNKKQTLVLEYLPNGTLWNFILRAIKADRPLPNRLLWRLFSCLLRFVIALAWPDNNPQEILLWDVPMSGLVHNDMHLNNVMIGELDDDEHRLAPILKLIDFGLAVEGAKGQMLLESSPAIASNINVIGKVMHALATGIPGYPGSGNTRTLTINLFGESMTLETNGSQLAGGSFPWVDDVLRNTIMWCLGTQWRALPSLDKLAAIVDGQLALRTAESYRGTPAEAAESDEAVFRYSTEVLLQPPPDFLDASPPPTLFSEMDYDMD
ncbi:hypothetical protein M426DRAFT_8014 [Hypoxylon sp. CI-4A]|nr:hypothetical protein M426DRAFT_8014 [Hypoxylon sp. CI-4A]